MENWRYLFWNWIRSSRKEKIVRDWSQQSRSRRTWPEYCGTTGLDHYLQQQHVVRALVGVPILRVSSISAANCIRKLTEDGSSAWVPLPASWETWRKLLVLGFCTVHSWPLRPSKEYKPEDWWSYLFIYLSSSFNTAFQGNKVHFLKKVSQISTHSWTSSLNFSVMFEYIYFSKNKISNEYCLCFLFMTKIYCCF